METSALLGSASHSAPGTQSKRRFIDEEGEVVSFSDYIQIAAGRVKNAPSCGAFYASLLAASITEIVWISHPWINPRHCCKLYYPESHVFFLVEVRTRAG